MAEEDSHQPLKRKRITADILSTGSYGFTRSNEREDKIRRLEELVEKVKHENLILKTDLEAKEISYKLDLEFKGKEIDKLLNSNRQLEEQVVLQSSRYEEAKETLAKFKAKHIEEMKTVTDALGRERDKIAQLERTVKEQTLSLQTSQDEFAATKNELTSNMELLEKSNAELNKSLEEKSKKVIETLQNDQKLLEEIRALKKKLLDHDDIYAIAGNNNTSTSESTQENEANMKHVMQDYYHVSARLMRLEDEKKKLEKDLGYYKRINQNIELLREEKQSLADRVKDMDAIRERNFALETENMKLKAEHNAWACYLSNNSSNDYNTQTPESIVYQLTKELEEAKYYKLASEQYKEELKDQLNIIQTMEQHLDEVKQKLAEYQQSQAKEEAAKSLWKQNEDTLKMHIKILESQLKMYDNAALLESNQDQHSLSHEGPNNDLQSFDDIKSKRIEELETLIRQLEEKISDQTQQLTQQALTDRQTAGMSCATTSEPNRALAVGSHITELLDQLQKKEEAHSEQLKERQVNEAMLEKKYNAAMEQLESLHRAIETRKQLETVTQSTSQHEDAATQHDQQRFIEEKEIDPYTQGYKTVKILQCMDSPAAQLKSIRQDTLDRLRKENEDLLKQILSSQQQEQHTTTVTIPSSTLTNLQKDIEQLQQTIQKRDKRLDRIQRVWASRLEDVRQLVITLLGYDIRIVGDNYDMVRLIPISPLIKSPSDLHFVIKRERLPEASSSAEHQEQLQQPTRHVEATVVDENYRYILRIVGTEKEHWLSNWRDLFDTHIVYDPNLPCFFSKVTSDLGVEAGAMNRAEEIRSAKQTEFTYEQEGDAIMEHEDGQPHLTQQLEDSYDYDQGIYDERVKEPYQNQQQQFEDGHDAADTIMIDDNEDGYHNSDTMVTEQQQQQLDELQHQLLQQITEPFHQQVQQALQDQSQYTLGDDSGSVGQHIENAGEEDEDYDYEENNEYERVEEDAYDESEYINEETEYIRVEEEEEEEEEVLSVPEEEEEEYQDMLEEEKKESQEILEIDDEDSDDNPEKDGDEAEDQDILEINDEDTDDSFEKEGDEAEEQDIVDEEKQEGQEVFKINDDDTDDSSEKDEDEVQNQEMPETNDDDTDDSSDKDKDEVQNQEVSETKDEGSDDSFENDEAEKQYTDQEQSSIQGSAKAPEDTAINDTVDE